MTTGLSLMASGGDFPSYLEVYTCCLGTIAKLSHPALFESLREVLSCGAIYCAMPGGSSP